MAATPSGKDKILKYARIFVGGYDLSCDARTVGTLANTFDEADVSGWCEPVTNFISGGVRTVGIDGFQGLMNDDTGRALTVLQSGTQQTQVSMLFGGGGEPAIPDPAYILAATQLSDGISLDGNVHVVEATFKPSATQYDANSANPLGVVLSNAEYTATTNAASHDNEASSANGWHANLHITATASGDYAFTIEHSADDSSWATLGTFTSDGSAITSEHLSGSGAVNQYVRFVATRTAGTVTAVCAFARN